MESSDLVARLAQHRTLGGAPREELAWLSAHGELYHAGLGDLVTGRPQILSALVIVLSGHLVVRVDRGLGPRKVMEWGAGDVTGYLPYSRMTRAIGEVFVDEPADLFLVPGSGFPEMTRECPAVTTALVHLMLDRVRQFTSSDLQDEKMMSLGKLAAGLAHELNNPASAAARSARRLLEEIASLERASRDLGAANLTDPQIAAIERSRHQCQAIVPSALSPIARADREEAIADWLDAHGADSEAASSLADTALRLEDFESLAAALDASALSKTLTWLAADCATRALATDVERATTRIHDLVAAVKRFTYMDRTGVAEAVDLIASLSDSIAMLLHKAKSKSVALAVTLEPDLPRVRAIGGDLNQVWTNLVDNALDAVSAGGHVEIAAARHLTSVVVRVVDDGPGIPEELREQIFDPFFTTKPVGQGTGLGLDIARRLVRRNDGDIEVSSRPGQTEFRVTLPIATEETKQA